jgi:hypothetical protein
MANAFSQLLIELNPRSGLGAAVCLLYGGFASFGRLAEKLWHRYRSDAIHRSVLVTGFDPVRSLIFFSLKLT